MCDEGGRRVVNGKENVKRATDGAIEVLPKKIIRAIHGCQAENPDENAQDDEDGTSFAFRDIGDSFAVQYAEQLHRLPSSSVSGPVMMASTPTPCTILPSSRLIRALARAASSGAWVT